MKTLFVTFEGPEGSGKTTQIKLLAQKLEAAGYAVVTTREPGGTPFGEYVRNLLLHPDHKMNPLAEVLLFNAARSQLIQDVITPALLAGQVVLCDRHTDSTLAYQGYGRGVDLTKVQALNDIAVAGIYPTMTVYLDIDPVESLARKQGGELNRIDAESLEFHRKVRLGYKRLLDVFPWRMTQFDARQRPEVIANEIWQEFQHQTRERVLRPNLELRPVRAG